MFQAFPSCSGTNLVSFLHNTTPPPPPSTLTVTKNILCRDLSKPIAVQNPARVPKYQETYRVRETVFLCRVVEYSSAILLKLLSCFTSAHFTSNSIFFQSLQEQYDISKKLDPMNCIPPYHFGSHYSNSGTVLHFLVRLVPFTKMFLTYQGMMS